MKLPRSLTGRQKAVTRSARAGELHRVLRLDQMRGVAILLMVADHGLVELGWASSSVRILTRPSLWLFMLCAGALRELKGRGPSLRRVAQLVAAGVVASGLISQTRLSEPHVLWVIVLALGAAHLLDGRAWWFVAMVGGIQASMAPVPWAGYQPGWVLLVYAVGAGMSGELVEGERLGGRAGWVLEVVGRYPLLWFVGHLAVLAGVSPGG